MTRLIGALGIIAILAGHFISAAWHEEIYLMGAAASGAAMLAHFPGIALGSWGLALMWVVFAFVLVVGSLGFAMALSVTMLFIAKPNKLWLRLNAVTFCTVGLFVGAGLLAVQERHGYRGSGFDQIDLNPYYFIFPALFLTFGVVYGGLAISRQPLSK